MLRVDLGFWIIVSSILSCIVLFFVLAVYWRYGRNRCTLPPYILDPRSPCFDFFWSFFLFQIPLSVLSFWVIILGIYSNIRVFGHHIMGRSFEM